MGIYNSQYENYYRGIANKKRTYKGNSKGPNIRVIPTLNAEYFAKKLTIDLIGVFVLFIVVITCKLVVTPDTAKVYNFSKKIVSEGYSIKQIATAISSFDYKSFEKKATDWIEDAKATLSKSKSYKAMLKEDFSLPIQGTIIAKYDAAHKGMDIEAKENSDIIASYEGTVKETGENKEIGKYVLIDHGGGLETRYGSLISINVAKGDKVIEDQIIGKCGNLEGTGKVHVHFEVMYMGESLDPQEYMYSGQI